MIIISTTPVPVGTRNESYNRHRLTKRWISVITVTVVMITTPVPVGSINKSYNRHCLTKYWILVNYQQSWAFLMVGHSSRKRSSSRQSAGPLWSRVDHHPPRPITKAVEPPDISLLAGIALGRLQGLFGLDADNTWFFESFPTLQMVCYNKFSLLYCTVLTRFYSINHPWWHSCSTFGVFFPLDLYFHNWGTFLKGLLNRLDSVLFMSSCPSIL